jgi:hypothetical protein
MKDWNRKVGTALAGAAAGIMLLGFAACSWNGSFPRESGLSAAPEIAGNETNGTSLGKETYAASLIARSDNTLSSQEKEIVLKEISNELDYIMDVVQSLEIADDDAETPDQPK